MNTFVQDTQTVPEVSSQLVEFLQAGSTPILLSLRNDGTNTMNYVVQEYNGTAWVDMGSLGTIFNNTLTAGQQVNLLVLSAFPKQRVTGYASGGALLNFTATRFFPRADGGPCPLLSL